MMADESTSLYGISPVSNSHNTTPNDLQQQKKHEFISVFNIAGTFCFIEAGHGAQLRNISTEIYILKFEH